MTISATTQGLRMGVATSTSRPTVPFDGQVISETDTDSLQVYNGTAWVGVGGLIPVIPTSVAVGSGTGTVSATGTVTFTGCSSVSLNGCFSATYTNYLMLANWYATSSADPTLRWRVGGTDNSTASSYVAVAVSSTGTAMTTQTDTGSSFYFSFSSGSAATAKTATIMNIYEPFLAVETRHCLTSQGTPSYNGTIFNGKHNQSTSYDGFSILSAYNLTGTLTVYGYTK